MKRAFLALLLLLAVVGCSTMKTGQKAGGEEATKRADNLLREMAATRAKQIGPITYTMWFGLDATHEDYEGRIVIRFILKDKAKDHSSDVLIDFEDGQIHSLTLNQLAVPEKEVGDYYDGHKIKLPIANLQTGSNRIEISYAHKYSTTGRGLHRFKDPVDGAVYLYSNFEPYDAHRMFPCFDQPDLKASFELTVEAPDDWEVISNTQEREVSDLAGDRVSWAFPPSPVFSTYVFALHAGPYHSWSSDAEGIPIRLFARESLAQYVDANEWLDVTRRGLEFYGNLFSYPYPYSKYDQIIVPDFNVGAMENVGAVTFTEHAIFRSKETQDRHRGRADTILHEMAHMWFGDLVTMRWWNGLWLNESFATLMAAWAVNDSTRFKGSWQSFFGGEKEWAYWEDSLVTTHPIELSVPDTDHAFANFDGITYGKGASVLKQLRYYLGVDDFTEGLRRYFVRFAYRNTTITDFIHSLSEASGRNLLDWQKLWLHTSGTNITAPSWACENDEQGRSKISRFVLTQKNGETSTELRPHKTKIALLRMEGGKLRVKDEIEVSYSGAETSVPDAIGKHCPDLVYPNYGDEDFALSELDPVSLKTAEESLAKVEDPFLRQMLWSSLWRMVIDAKLSAQHFADIALSQGKAEKDTQILTKILKNLISSRLTMPSAMKFMAPDIANAYRPKVEKFMRARVQSGAPGSDVQLIAFRGFLDAATSPESIDLLEKLLKGKTKISGLRIDQDRRWEIIQALARLGAKDMDAQIAAELTKDSTDMGQRQSLSAYASLPDPQNKLKWFGIISKTGEPKYIDNQLREAMAGYNLMGQEELIRATAPKFFDLLAKLSSSEDEEYLHNYAKTMFPALCDPSVVDGANQFLKNEKSAPTVVIRAIKINKQETERCIRARALSAKEAQ